MSLVPYRVAARTGVFPHIMDRAKPGSIGVLSTGRRFVNEANGYYDYVAAMIAAAPEGEPVQAWQIADARFVRRFPLGMAKPRPVPLFPYLRSGYLKKGRTLAELARACGIDPAGLTATVEEFNRHARRGEDPDFGRGATPFNRYGGDPSVGPNPSLAPLEKGPFYAVRIVPGSFGTFAGLATDARARVLDADDAPVPGLYAVGNDQASVMGGHYPAGGINIGPAMTFGYVAGRDLAGVDRRTDVRGEPGCERLPRRHRAGHRRRGSSTSRASPPRTVIAGCAGAADDRTTVQARKRQSPTGHAREQRSPAGRAPLRSRRGGYRRRSRTPRPDTRELERSTLASLGRT